MAGDGIVWDDGTKDPGGIDWTPEPTPAPAERGLIGETVAGLKRGGLQAVNMVGQAARTLDPEGGVDVVRNAGRGLSDWAEKRSQESDVAPSSYIENHPVLGNIPKAAEMVIPSIAPTVAGIGAGLATGNPLIGAATAGVVGSAGFGLPQYTDTYERAIAKGIDPDTAHKAALKTALVMGAGGAVMGVIPEMRAFKLAAPAEGAVLKSMFTPTLANTAKALGNTAAHVGVADVGTMMTQSYLNAKTEKDAGIRPDADPTQEAIDSIGPAIGLSLIMGGVAGTGNKLSRMATQHVLEKTSAQPHVRMQAVDNVYQTLLVGERDGIVPAGGAENWLQNATQLVKENKPITLDDSLLSPQEVMSGEAKAGEAGAVAGAETGTEAVPPVSPEEMRGVDGSGSDGMPVLQPANDLKDAALEGLAKSLTDDSQGPLDHTVEALATNKVAEEVQRQKVEDDFKDVRLERLKQGAYEAPSVPEDLQLALADEGLQPVQLEKNLIKNPSLHRWGVEAIPEEVQNATTEGARAQEVQSEHPGVDEGISRQGNDRNVQTGEPGSGGQAGGGDSLRAAAEAGLKVGGTQDLGDGRIAVRINHPEEGDVVAVRRTIDRDAIGNKLSSPKYETEGIARVNPDGTLGSWVRPPQGGKEERASLKKELSDALRGPEGEKPVEAAPGVPTNAVPGSERPAVRNETATPLTASQIRKGLTEQLGKSVGAKTFDFAEPTTETAKWASNVAEAFGHKVQMFKGSLDAEGFVLPSQPDTIFLKEGSKKSSFVFVMGHEMTHALRAQNPELYDEIRTYVETSTTPEKMMLRRDTMRESSPLRKGLTDAQLNEEIIADLVGGEFQKPGFWDKMAESEPDLFTKVLSFIRNFIEVVRQNLGAYRSISSDLTRLDTVTAAVFAKYARLQQEGKFTGDPLGNEARFFTIKDAREAGMLVPAVMRDGVVKVARPGETHYDARIMVSARRHDGQRNVVGFVTPDGRMLDRKESLAWLQVNRPDVYRRLDKVTRENGLESQAYAHAEGMDTEEMGLAEDFMRKQFGAKFSSTPEPWFSKLEDHLTNKLKSVKDSTALPVSHIEGLLKDQGLTKDEVEQSGLKDFLRGKDRVTKREVLDELKANAVQYEDVVLGGDQAYDDKFNQRANEIFMADPENIDMREAEAQARLELGKAPQETHFSQYTEPGAKEGSYREMFVTAPGEKGSKPDSWNIVRKSTGEVVTSYISEERARKAAESQPGAYDVVPVVKGGWGDGHQQYQDIKNPVVRVRFNERTGPNGEKLMFVEEMQGPSDQNQEKMPEYLRKRIYDIGVKRVLAYAKEHGFEGVAWTPGEMQAKRYDLSKQVDEVTYDSQTKTLQAWQNRSPVMTENVEPDRIGDYVGKEVAKNLLSQEGGFKSVSGEGLKVGGEGLKRLYDKTLPALFKKYGKEGVGETAFNTKIDEDFEAPRISEYADGSAAVEYRGDTTEFDTVDEAEAYRNSLLGDQTSVPFLPIGSNTPTSFARFASVADSLQHVNSWGAKATEVAPRVAKDFVDQAFRFIMPIDRVVRLAQSRRDMEPIKNLLDDYRRNHDSKSGHAGATRAEGAKRVTAYTKAFTTEDARKTGEKLAWTATLYELHADPTKPSPWTEQEWRESGKQAETGKTLGAAQREVHDLWEKLTPEQRVAHQDLVDHMAELHEAYLTGTESFIRMAYNPETADRKIEQFRELAGTLKGDYFPLMRKGDFLVRVFSIENGERGEREGLYSYKSKQEALDAVKEFQAQGKHAEPFRKEDFDKNVVNIPLSFLDDIRAKAEARGYSGEVVDHFMSDLRAARASLMPKLSTEQFGMRRKGVAGHDENMLEAYANYVGKFGSAVANLEYGSKVEQNFRDMKNTVNALRSKPNNLTDQLNTIDSMDVLLRHLQQYEYAGDKEKINTAVRLMGKTTFLWYLASPAVFAVQWSQPFMITIPKIAARYGFGNAFGGYTNAMKEFFGGKYADEKITAFDHGENSRGMKNAGRTLMKLMEQEREAVTETERRGLKAQQKELFDSFTPDEQKLLILKVMSLQSALDLAESHNLQDLMSSNSTAEKWLDEAVKKGGWFMQKSEAGSRRAAAVASFKLALEEGRSILEANDYANDVIYDTLYNFDASNRAPWMRGNVGRIVGQFQFFRLHTLGKVAQLAKDAWGKEFDRAIAEANGDEAKIAEAKNAKAEARRELAYMMGTSFALAGAGGTPLALALGNTFTDALWGALSFLFGDDDDPWDPQRDFEKMIRESMGDTAGNVVLKGLPSLLGMDISRRVGMGGMADMIQGDPPAGMSGTDKANWYAGRALGPSWGIISDGFRALDAVSNGDMGTAISASSPKLVRDMVKLYKLDTEGVRAGGKTLLGSDEINPYQLALVLSGINPSEVALAQEESRYIKNLSTTLAQRRSGLLRSFTEATIDGDYDKRQEALDAINQWGIKQPQLKITTQNLASAVKRGMDARAGKLTKREALMQEKYGVKGGE